MVGNKKCMLQKCWATTTRVSFALSLPYLCVVGLFLKSVLVYEAQVEKGLQSFSVNQLPHPGVILAFVSPVS